MGTVTNGKKWVGACVNGKVVSGLAKNGVVFYRKPVSTYRRRIMVGDNLSNRTIFQDFPDGFYKSGMSDGEQFNLIESNNINIYEYYIDGSYNVYCGNRTNSNLLYRYDLVFGRTMTKKDVTTGNYSNAIVTEVNENEAYRHIFIEDENIRPVQVGDVITRNTRFYFTIPDNIFEQLPQGRDNVIILNNGESISLNADLFSSGIYFNTTSGMDTNMNIIVVINNKLMANKSTMQNISYNGDYFEGTVSEVNNSSPVYSMILVDTTTLG
ncbi:MAG TPA: hypothetical protein IAD49_06885 [Candidatus Fimihabitans intestinipullorum]|uniref:Uncharacterized protein n=1 Tax=Candidatus Fimihabitans intestinipullorum TaxID=2840820 RepID=A0A9D1HVG0_9BACT|nr:hypothetical protein [Candidatus Fimihabitans intestinipullorum]